MGLYGDNSIPADLHKTLSATLSFLTSVLDVVGLSAAGMIPVSDQDGLVMQSLPAVCAFYLVFLARSDRLLTGKSLVLSKGTGRVLRLLSCLGLS